MMRPLTPSQASVRALAILGATRHEVAEALGITPDTASAYATRAREAGWSVVFARKRRDGGAPSIQRAAPLVRAGLGCAEIGRRLGISRQRASIIRAKVISGA